MPKQISGNQFDRRLGIFSYNDLKTRTTISYYVGKGRLTRFARNQLQHTANGCQTLNFFIIKSLLTLLGIVNKLFFFSSADAK